MADILHLNLSGMPEEIDASDYPVPEAGFKLLERGYYNFRLIDGGMEDEQLGRNVPIRFTSTSKGRLQATYAVEVADGPYAGRKLRFQKVNNAPRANSQDLARRKTSSMGDMLMSLGYEGPLATDADYANGLESVINRVARGRVRYSGYCKQHRIALQDKDFPAGATEAPCISDAAHSVSAREELDAWFKLKETL